MIQKCSSAAVVVKQTGIVGILSGGVYSLFA